MYQTAVNAAMAVLARRCKLLLVVITTTLSNRNKMWEDLNDRYFNELPEDARPKCVTITKQKGSTKDQHKQLLKQCIGAYGIVVSNLTNAAIDNVRDLIQNERGIDRVGWALIKVISSCYCNFPLRVYVFLREKRLTQSFAGRRRHIRSQLRRTCRGPVHFTLHKF